MNRIGTGILAGTIAGVLDVVPMILQKLPFDANLSAFLMWIVVGFFLSTSNLKIPGVTRGIFIAFMILAPTAVIIGFKEPMSLIPIAAMTTILGAGLGWFVDSVGFQK